jgi:hypothetical protein
MPVTGHLHGERTCDIHKAVPVHGGRVIEGLDSPEMTEVHVILRPGFYSEEQKRNDMKQLFACVHQFINVIFVSLFLLMKKICLILRRLFSKERVNGKLKY